MAASSRRKVLTAAMVAPILGITAAQARDGGYGYDAYHKAREALARAVEGFLAATAPGQRCAIQPFRDLAAGIWAFADEAEGATFPDRWS